MLKNYLPSNWFILSNFQIDFSDFVRWFIRDITWTGQSIKHQAKITVNDAFYRSVYNSLAITEFIVSLESFIKRPEMWFVLLCCVTVAMAEGICIVWFPICSSETSITVTTNGFWLMAEWWNLLKFLLLSLLILGLLLKWPLGPVLFK